MITMQNIKMGLVEATKFRIRNEIVTYVKHQQREGNPLDADDIVLEALQNRHLQVNNSELYELKFL